MPENSLKNKRFILFLYRKAIKKQFAVCARKIFLRVDFSSSPPPSSSYRLYQGKERNLPLFCVSSSPLRAAFNRINGLFMFFPSHPSLIHNNLRFFLLHLIMRSHIIYTHTPETCLSYHTLVNFIRF